MKGKYWYIKERHNPQFKPYFTAMGQLTVAEAKKSENSAYGTNYMQKFTSETEYKSKCVELGI